MALVDGMTRKDWIKLILSALGGVCSAMIAASVRNWHDAFSPPAVFGALAAICSSVPAWLANTPTNPKSGTDQGGG